MTKDVGERIKRIRLTRNLSQEALADVLKISQSAYAKMENGQSKIEVERLLKIAEYLEVEPYELMLPSDKVVHFTNNTIQNAYAHIDNYVQAKDELYQDRISHLEEEIKFLREELRKKA